MRLSTTLGTAIATGLGALLVAVPTGAASSAVGAAPTTSAPAASAPDVPTTDRPAARKAARKADRYRADITWTEHGIPHIKAKDFVGLGYGSGYAAAEMSLCTLFDTLVTGRGERSRWFGPDEVYDDQVTLRATNLQVDTVVTDLHDRRVVEGLLKDRTRGPGRQARQMVDGYVAGINRWVRENKVTDPACKGAGYIKPNVTTLDLWYGVYLANLLASTGVFMAEIADAATWAFTRLAHR